MVLNHVQITVSSLPEAKAFYLKALAPLGYTEFFDKDGQVGLMADGVPDLWFGAVKGRNDSPSKGLHVAFTASSRDIVDQFYEAALKAGAKDNGAPGERLYVAGYYAAYVFDLDGNNIEVVHIGKS